MSKLFLDIYDWFEQHRRAFWAILVALVGVCAAMASQLSFQENITSFFGNGDEKKSAAFANVAIKDKIVVMLSGENPDDIVAAAEVFEREIAPLQEEGLIDSVTAYADEEAIGRVVGFVYDHLPIFLTDADYRALEERLTAEGIESSVESAYNLLTSPSGMAVGEVVMRDPLNIGTPSLQAFQRFSPDAQYEIYDGRLFTGDLTTMLMFIQPSNGMGDTGNNDRLVSGLEKAEREAERGGVRIDCIGGPIVAVYNARQIKSDTTITLGLAMVFILIVIFLSFRNRKSIPLIVVPPAFGAIFALAMVWLIQGEISAIAIGAGTVVLGISLSYSIHIVAHLNNIASPKEIIRELAMPLTVGCFTTIGAFAALMFTSSALLRDMGLFAVFTLIGTALFCLVFMPQFLRGFGTGEKSYLLRKIERAVGYRYDGNRWVVLSIVVLSIVALFFYNDVEFDDDMSDINYVPARIAEAERRSLEIFGDESKNVYIVTGGANIDESIAEYGALEELLNKYKAEGRIEDMVTLDAFVVAESVQRERIERWNRFWAQRREGVITRIDAAARRVGFRSGAFEPFYEVLDRQYAEFRYTKENVEAVPILAEWITVSDKRQSLLCRIAIEAENKAEVYGGIDTLANTAVIDRGYFSSKMVEATSADFNYILLVSSLIVFVALLLSYGRLELTALTFLPMAVSWVIILGMMAVFDIKFNIVNIILATFIFGIGDDFSIFIMDGLIQEYRNGKAVLDAHKTAIFFSAFTAVVGMGVLIFARHPALKSIALISVLGLSVVVVVAYTVQPALFRLMVVAQTRKGGFPYTFGSMLNTLGCYLYFVAGCLLAQVYMIVLMVLPIRRRAKKLAFHKMLYRFTRIFLKTMVAEKTIRENPFGETFDKSAVIVANHQSFIDILLLLSTTPKVVMMTKSWVWNSPFFGWIVRYADFYHAADGYEALARRVQERVREGYSVVVFPEGTRSADCSIQRFHKGAFYLAHLLKLDILPMVIYGTGAVAGKRQWFYIKPGIVATKTLRRIAYGDASFGATYQEQAKAVRRMFAEQYSLFAEELGRATNPYFRDALIKGYIYKGPALEWAVRRRCRADGFYDEWDRALPRKATITEMGCGYGQMAYMLGLLSADRTITGIDGDADKIDVARHSFLSRQSNVRFECADMREATIPTSDAVVFNDSLRGVDAEARQAILRRASESLTAGGRIIVREGNAVAVEPWLREAAQAIGLEICAHRSGSGNGQTLCILTKESR